MKTGEKIAFFFVGILVLIAVAICFLLNVFFGVFMLLFTVGVFWWTYGVKKKKTDNVLLELAKETGLSCNRSALKYYSLSGIYRGHEVEVSIERSLDALGGAGALLAATTGTAAYAAMEIRNFTAIKMRHGLSSVKDEIISNDWPKIVVHGEKLTLALPYVSNDKEEIIRGLDTLSEITDDLARQG